MVVTVLICIATVLLGAAPVRAEEETEVSIFYENACAACREDVELEELYRNSVPLELRERSELRLYNIFEESNRKTFEEICAQECRRRECSCRL